MVTDVRKRFSRLAAASSAGLVALAFSGLVWSQQNATPPASRQEARERAKEKIDAAKDSKQGARETTRDAREGARDTARDDRQTTRNTRADARDTARDGRQTIREARRDARAARREFIASRIRSGDLGLFLRRAADRLTVADVAARGAISQTGLKEGDEIISVNGQPIHSERDFVDELFANHESNKPVEVVINRAGQKQTVMISPKPFVDEHLANNDNLQDLGLILDESNPNRVKVQAVVPRSPAFYAGVRSGDEVTGFSGQRIAAVADLVKQITNLAQGGTAPLEVRRNNQTRQLDIEIPGEADEARTAAKPVLPNDSAASAPRDAQGNLIPPPLPQPTLPNLNPPR